MTDARTIIGTELRSRDAQGLYTPDEMADAIIAALSAQGLVIVPREPSDEMVVAGDERIIEVLNDHSFSLRPKTPAQLCYEAMLAAATPPGEA